MRGAIGIARRSYRILRSRQPPRATRLIRGVCLACPGGADGLRCTGQLLIRFLAASQFSLRSPPDDGLVTNRRRMRTGGSDVAPVPPPEQDKHVIDLRKDIRDEQDTSVV